MLYRGATEEGRRHPRLLRLGIVLVLVGALVLAFLLGTVVGDRGADRQAGAPEVAPSASDTPTPSRAPTPTPSETSSPSPSAEELEVEEISFPDASTTGVPEGVELEERGPLVVTEDGAVVDGLDIRGTVRVAADDVTIRNSRIRGDGRYAIEVESGYDGLLVEDVEIDGTDIESAAVCCSNYTLRRVDIHDVTEGPRAGSNVTIEDSYIHHMRRCRDRTFEEGCHIDAIQSTDGSDIVIRGNNLQAYNPETGITMNAAFMFGEDLGDLSDVLFEGNLVNGGNYAINGGGSGTTDAEVEIRGNRFGRDFRHAPAGNLGPNVDFDEESNVYHDTGEPIIDDVR